MPSSKKKSSKSITAVAVKILQGKFKALCDEW